MQVEVIAITQYLGKDAHSKYGSEALIEHAGRTCYRSHRPGTPEATAQFIQRRIEEGHESIIEHASASFEISGISRACSHQLVRHRLASYSQESQRYVDMSDPEWVIPPDIAHDPVTADLWHRFLQEATSTYHQLRAREIKKEDARFLLPNATATRLIMTANYRELLHMFQIRISPHAQWEIRELCVRMLEAICSHAPNVFSPLRTRLRELYPSFFVYTNVRPGADGE